MTAARPLSPSSPEPDVTARLACWRCARPLDGARAGVCPTCVLDLMAAHRALGLEDLSDVLLDLALARLPKAEDAA